MSDLPSPKPSRVIRGALKSIAERSTEGARRCDARIGLTHQDIADRIVSETEAEIEALRADFLSAIADGVLSPAEAASLKRRIESARESIRRA